MSAWDRGRPQKHQKRVQKHGFWGHFDQKWVKIIKKGVSRPQTRVFEVQNDLKIENKSNDQGGVPGNLIFRDLSSVFAALIFQNFRKFWQKGGVFHGF